MQILKRNYVFKALLYLRTIRSFLSTYISSTFRLMKRRISFIIIKQVLLLKSFGFPSPLWFIYLFCIKQFIFLY